MLRRNIRSAGGPPNLPEGRRPQPTIPMQIGALPADHADLPAARAAQRGFSGFRWVFVESPQLNPMNVVDNSVLQQRDIDREYFANYLAGVYTHPDRTFLVERLPRNEKRIDSNLWEDIYKLEIPRAFIPPLQRRCPPWQLHGNAAKEASLLHDQAQQEALSTFQSLGFYVGVLKILGYGGNGAAFLCETLGSRWEPDNKQRNKFVLKLDLSGYGMAQEKKLMMRLRRSKHLTQILKVKDLWPKEVLRADVHGIEDFIGIIEDDPSIQMLELMKNGDMASMLDKIAYSDTAHMIREQAFFIKQCWKIFICLIRACIDMQYPPRRKVQPETGAVRYLDEDGEDLSGGIPFDGVTDGSLPPGYDLIHFDLDPSNVLIGDYNADGHQGVPIFKVADFGLALRTTSVLFNSYQALTLRKNGKSHWLLPEQFTREWEFVDSIPAMQNPQPKVAGQYGPHSNVYAVGNCMLELLTGFCHPDPPRARGPVNSLNGNEDFPKDFVVSDIYGRPVPSFWTHGFPLRDNKTDPLLRDMVMRCLADKPADRPGLRELSDLIDAIEREPSWDGPNDWIDFGLYFQHPPRPQMNLDPTSLAGWEEFYPLNGPSAPPRGNVGNEGRPLAAGTALDNVWNPMNPLPPVGAAAGPYPQRSAQSSSSIGGGWPVISSSPPNPPTTRSNSSSVIQALLGGDVNQEDTSGSQHILPPPRASSQKTNSSSIIRGLLHGDAIANQQISGSIAKSIQATDALSPTLPPPGSTSNGSSNSSEQGSGGQSQQALAAEGSAPVPGSQASRNNPSVNVSSRQTQTSEIPLLNRFSISGGSLVPTQQSTADQLSPAYLGALVDLGYLSASQSGRKRSRSTDLPLTSNAQDPSPDIADLRRKLRALQADSGSPIRLPVGGELTTDAGAHGDEVTTQPLPGTKTPDVSGSNTSEPTSSSTPFFSPQAFPNFSPSAPSPAKQRTPERPLRRVGRQQIPRSPVRTISFATSPSRTSSLPAGIHAPDNTVAEQVYQLYWPPERQRRPRNILQRVVDRTRQLGRNIIANRRRRIDRQREALRDGVSHKAEASDGDDNTQARTPDGYAGVFRYSSGRREVFYVPPPGYIVRGFQRVNRWGGAEGGRRQTYFYDPSSIAGQMIIQAGQMGVVPSTSEYVNG